MEAYSSNTFSDEEGPLHEKVKSIIIQGSKSEILNLANFINQVATYLNSNDYCHMHFGDYKKEWDKKKHFDLEINVE